MGWRPGEVERVVSDDNEAIGGRERRHISRAVVESRLPSAVVVASHGDGRRRHGGGMGAAEAPRPQHAAGRGPMPCGGGHRAGLLGLLCIASLDEGAVVEPRGGGDRGGRVRVGEARALDVVPLVRGRVWRRHAGGGDALRGEVDRLELVHTQRAAAFARRQQRSARPHLCGREVGAVPEGDGERRRLEGVAAGSDARHARDAVEAAACDEVA
mmetsp:Transcript_12094/g.38534  ORF Transcript_12094/g.38534 Transcript_12094/m.38534 type:complete len:213 (-) Transcript_12094:12-650(-)